MPAGFGRESGLCEREANWRMIGSLVYDLEDFVEYEISDKVAHEDVFCSQDGFILYSWLPRKPPGTEEIGMRPGHSVERQGTDAVERGGSRPILHARRRYPPIVL